MIAAPRASIGHRRWLPATQMAAVMAGSFVASCNRRSYDGETFSGGSWRISPEGEVLAQSTVDEPFVTVTINPADADIAERSYPRNIYAEPKTNIRP